MKEKHALGRKFLSEPVEGRRCFEYAGNRNTAFYEKVLKGVGESGSVHVFELEVLGLGMRLWRWLGRI